MKNELLMLTCLIFITCCGQGFKQHQVDYDSLKGGVWDLTFYPVNSQFGTYRGQGYLTISQDQFWAHFSIYGPSSPVQHLQFLHVGERCPNAQDDSNHDGYIDFLEAKKVVGAVLIPLDRYLNSRTKGSRHFPRLKKWHQFYYYSAAANSKLMMEDLRHGETSENELLSPFTEEDLKLEGRIIMIYGAWSEKDYPTTIGTIEGISPQESLPVACSQVIFRGDFSFY